MRKAQSVDRVYGGVAPGVVGPVERKLQTFGEIKGLVIGAFGEASEDVHSLVQSLANSRLQMSDLLGRGRAAKGELAVIVGQIRRQISVAGVRAQANCLLGKLNSLGEGVGGYDRRRQLALSAEEAWMRERHAHALSLKYGSKVLRKGFFNLD